MMSHSPSPTPSPSKTNIDVLQVWRKKVITNLSQILSIAAIIAYIANLASNYDLMSIQAVFGYTISLVFILIAAYYPRITTRIRAYILTIVIFTVGIQAVVQFAVAGDARTWFFLAIFFASIFLGQRAGIFFSIASLIVWAIVAYLFNIATIPIPSSDPLAISLWTSTAVSFLIASVIMTLTISHLLRNLAQTIEHNTRLAKTSEQQNIELNEQHTLLKRRSKTLEATASISQDLAILTDYGEVLEKTPMLINDILKLSSTTLFLFDAENTLRQVSSYERTDQAKNIDESLSDQEKDFLNRSIADKRAYSNINLNPEEDSQTCLAIPMQGQEKIIGALFLQSDDVEAFGAERVSVLQMLANHIAILLENAKLLTQRESALDAERRAYGEIAQGAWKKFVSEQEYGSYRRDEKGLRSVPTEAYLPQEAKEGTEAVPIRVRGKVIGHIDARKAKNRAWTASEKELLGILASRLETAIEGARLYQEARERAQREQIIAEVSAKMREKLEVESVLESAARELRNALGIAEAEIWLNIDSKQEQ